MTSGAGGSGPARRGFGWRSEPMGGITFQLLYCNGTHILFVKGTTSQEKPHLMVESRHTSSQDTPGLSIAVSTHPTKRDPRRSGERITTLHKRATLLYGKDTTFRESQFQNPRQASDQGSREQ